MESWVGILPWNVRAFGSVDSLGPLVGTKAILMRIWREAARWERALKAAVLVLSPGFLEWK